ncbi:hypothetical protein M885DRAFT_573030 [Pelagophyceae sp. CCMP2097]|nr:hypothetical protein M885DRAFT_573030 [Pelagophyceae sp. CCMP2097]
MHAAAPAGASDASEDVWDASEDVSSEDACVAWAAAVGAAPCCAAPADLAREWRRRRAGGQREAADACADALSLAVLSPAVTEFGPAVAALAWRARRDATHFDDDDDDDVWAVGSSLLEGPLSAPGKSGDASRRRLLVRHAAVVAGAVRTAPARRSFGVLCGLLAAAVRRDAPRDAAEAARALDAVAALLGRSAVRAVLREAARPPPADPEAAAAHARTRQLAALLALRGHAPDAPNDCEGAADPVLVEAICNVDALLSRDAFFREEFEARVAVSSKGRVRAFSLAGDAAAATDEAAAARDRSWCATAAAPCPTPADVERFAAPPGPDAPRSLASLRGAEDPIHCAFRCLAAPHRNVEARVEAGVDFYLSQCDGDGAGARVNLKRRRDPDDGGDEARRLDDDPARSIVVLGGDARFRCAALLRRTVQRHFAAACSVNVYCTPAGAQALDAHHDDHDVFVVQLAGRKQWRLYAAGGALLPRLGDARLTPGDAALRGAHATVSLEPGDVLYVPRGTVHAATANGAAHSIHATIGLDLVPMITWEGTVHLLLRGGDGDDDADDANDANENVDGADDDADDGAEGRGTAAMRREDRHAAVRFAARHVPALRRACLPAVVAADRHGGDAEATLAAVVGATVAFSASQSGAPHVDVDGLDDEFDWIRPRTPPRVALTHRLRRATARALAAALAVPGAAAAAVEEQRRHAAGAVRDSARIADFFLVLEGL